MTKFRYIFELIGCLSLTANMAFCQPELTPPGMPELAKFSIDALSFQSAEPGVSRLDLYIEVPYEAMQFTKSGDNFISEYEVSVNVFDTLETLVTEKWWTEKIEVQDYQQTTSRAMSNLNQRSFLLTPGAYFVNVQVKDKESETGSRVKKKVRIKKYTDVDFEISDILIANQIDFDSGKTSIYPNISGNVGGARDSFPIYFEAYGPASLDSVKYFIGIFSMKGDTIRSDSFSYPQGIARRPVFRSILSSGLIPGDYLLSVRSEVVNATDGSPAGAVSSRSFAVRWRGIPVTITDFDQAIEQLDYIADREIIDQMLKAPMERKRNRFQEFWRSKDPTPDDDRNEMMEEYYARIAYANKHFGHYIDGWKTDMGMVYVIFGSPSNIERHPFDIDSKPYEIWTYYEISREFIFVDVTGFGDYRLQNPLWDLKRTRPRR